MVQTQPLPEIWHHLKKLMNSEQVSSIIKALELDICIFHHFSPYLYLSDLLLFQSYPPKKNPYALWRNSALGWWLIIPCPVAAKCGILSDGPNHQPVHHWIYVASRCYMAQQGISLPANKDQVCLKVTDQTQGRWLNTLQFH